jgi:hypothetical protein
MMTRRNRRKEQRAELGSSPYLLPKRILFTLSLVVLFLAATGPAFGRATKVAGNLCSQNPEAVATNVSPDQRDPGQALARRYMHAWEVISMHGVWYTPDVYLQFYADPDLVAYLAGISNPVVLAVYSPSPIHFRSGEVILVSTGFILESHGEGDLFEAIARDGGCPLAPGNADRFSAVQAKLALGTTQYHEAIQPQLRCREVTRLQLRRR